MWFVLASMAEEGHFSTNFAKKTLFCSEILLVWSDLHSLILSLSSGTSHEGLHWVWYSVYSHQSARSLYFLLCFVLAHWRTVLNFYITLMYGRISHLYAYQWHWGKLSFHLMPSISILIWKLQILFCKTLACRMFVQSSMKGFCGQMMSWQITSNYHL